MPRKPKISAARKAIFDANGADDATRESLNKQLKEHLPRLVTIYAVPAEITGEDAQGNYILTEHFSYQQERQNRILQHVENYKRYAPKFQQIFGVRLKTYWDNIIGFDCVKFDEEFIQSGDESCHDVIKAKYGDEASRICRVLLGEKDTTVTPAEVT